MHRLLYKYQIFNENQEVRLMAKKNKGKSRVALIIILIIAAVIVGFVLFGGAQNGNVVAGNYTTTEVLRQDMETTVRGSGVVEAQNKLDAYAPSIIAISEVYAENGDEIAVGDAIAKVDKDAYLDAETALEDSIAQIDASIDSMYSSKGSTGIYSSVKGIVKIVYVEPGDFVEAAMNEYSALAVISADDNMRLEMAVDDTSAFVEGDKVFVEIDEDKVEATITEIDVFESTLKIVFEDLAYEVGAKVKVYDENDAEIGSAEMTINVPVYINGDAGVVNYVWVKAETSVSNGTKLFSLKDNDASGNLIDLTEQKEDLQEQLDDLRQGLVDMGLGEDYIIYAMVAGIMDELTLTPYMTVAEGMKMFTLQSTHPLMMEVDIDELDIAQVKVGQVAEVKFEALAGETYEGEITKINALGQSVNGVTNYQVTVIINEPGDILIGMSGNANILTDKKENVLTIPVEAVQLIDDDYYVIMGADANIITVADHMIETGLNDGAYIEVIEGLTDGDIVAIPMEEELDVGFGPGR